MVEKASTQILMVLTSHDFVGDTNRRTGVCLGQFADAYFLFADAGAEITLASPKGGQPPIDPPSDRPGAQGLGVQGESIRRFKGDTEARMSFADTLRLDQVCAADFDAAFYPGGRGSLWDLANDPVSAALISALHARGKPIAFVGHGVAALHSAVDSAGRALVAGLEIAGVSNMHERAAGFDRLVPFLIEDDLRRLGARFQAGKEGEPCLVQDGGVVTGQGRGLAAAAARLLLEALLSP